MTTARVKTGIHLTVCIAPLAGLLGSAMVVTPAHAAGIIVNSSADASADVR